MDGFEHDAEKSEVTEHLDALDLGDGVFTKDDPEDIARSLKGSAEHTASAEVADRMAARGLFYFWPIGGPSSDRLAARPRNA